MRKLDLKHWSSSISTLLGSRDKNVLQSYTKDHCQNHTYTLKDFHNYIRLEWGLVESFGNDLMNEGRCW